MSISADRMIVAARTVMDHIKREHTAAWDAEKKQFYNKYRLNLRRVQQNVQAEFDELVRARLYAFADAVTARTAADVAGCKALRPLESVVQHFYDIVNPWCDKLAAERREIIQTLFKGFYDPAEDFHTHCHFLAKAYRATIEQRHIANWPDARKNWPTRAVPVTEAIEALEQGELDETMETIAPETEPGEPADASQPRNLLRETLANHRWEDVGVKFLADDTLLFKSLITENRSRRMTYAELGFQDGRGGNRPRILWDILKDIIANDGVVDWTERTKLAHARGRSTTSLPKTISLLGMALRKATGIDESPFKPYVKSTNRRYEARFEVLKSEIPKEKIRSRS